MRTDAPVFTSWRDRARQSLGALYGNDHPYYKRFSSLHFCDGMIVIGKPKTWSARDVFLWNADFQKAEEIMRDAIEEFRIAPHLAAKEERPAHRTEDRPSLINIYNVLSQEVSQITTVEVAQLLGELDKLELPQKIRDQAKAEANELASEINGPRRWPVMAKCLNGLKGLGKPVYEQVALPLLLSLIKRESGL